MSSEKGPPGDPETKPADCTKGNSGVVQRKTPSLPCFPERKSDPHSAYGSRIVLLFDGGLSLLDDGKQMAG
jgi:hypothetical protein